MAIPEPKPPTGTTSSANGAQAAGRCPFPHGTGPAPVRKTAVHEAAGGAPLECDASGVWHARGYQEAKALLRSGATRQAGFRAEQVAGMPGSMRPPVLFQEGESHREQRTKAARFFTPVTTSKKYRGFMEAFADELVAEFVRAGRAELSALSMKLAVQVAAQVVGLTDSRTPGIAERIEAFFKQGTSTPLRGPGRLLSQLKNHWRVGKFYFLDVQPAIKSRRTAPREDVISHLLEEGYSGVEVLTECITYGAAGMVTTREFISAAAWHLLEHPELRVRYLAAEEKERHQILHELLRLEPVVGHVLRRTLQDVTIEGGGEPVTIPAGALVDVHVYGANADESAVGEEPLAFCTGRPLAQGVQPYVMSFGDGHHRCPGLFVAIQETDIFLTKLLALPGLTLEAPPKLSRNELVKGYEIREFWLRLA